MFSYIPIFENPLKFNSTEQSGAGEQHLTASLSPSCLLCEAEQIAAADVKPVLLQQINRNMKES